MSGLSYIGHFKDKKREGFGKLIWPDGSSYEGYFHNDIREGQGTHKWGDSGETYEGKYHNDKRHGPGMYRWPSGASFTGIFKEDLKVGPGMYVSPHGEKYEGVYHDDMRFGEGVVTYPGGRQDVGIWRGMKLVRLKFALREVTLDPLSSRHLSKSCGLHTPDVRSRGMYGPKGYLEVASQEFIQEAANGNLSKVKAMLESGAVYVDAMDKKGHSALFAAAVIGHCEIVNYLLDNGADVNQTDDMGVSVLNACNHVLFSSHPKVKVLLDQLQVALPPSVPPQSSILSSEGGDTEVLFTSDFPSSVQFCEEEEDDDVDINSSQIPDHLNCVATGPALTRSRSVLALSEVESSGMSQVARLYRTRSYPQLQCHGDKHVRFWAGQGSSNKVDSTFSGIDSQSSRGICSSSSKAQTVKSKEIYVNFSYYNSSKHSYLAGLTREDGTLVSGSEEAGQVDIGTTATESQLIAEGGNSLTASANGEIMGVSAVNSEFSPSSHLAEEVEEIEELYCGQTANPSELSTKSDTSLSLRKLSSSISKLSSLPNMTVSIIRTDLDTPTSASKPSVNHPGASSSLKTSPYRHAKKRVTIPSLGPGELHGSSVFSSTRYGPIVSAAESTTLSCAGSDQDVITDSSSSSTSVNIISVVAENLSQRVSKLQDLIMLLLSRGADPNVSPLPLQPMFYAVLAGEVELVKNLLESGAKAEESLPNELGGYSLLHLATGNISFCSPVIVELLLQHRADPNSGGRGGHQESVPNCRDMESTKQRKRKLIGGENEGDTKVTPLHTLCSVELPKLEGKRKEVSELVPILVKKLIEYGADVNQIANGHTPLALTIINGHDTSVHILLENGADPTLPLGKGVGNVLCALTTIKAHKSRALMAITAAVELLHTLILAGADIFVKVMLAKGKVGTVPDFAHAAFQADRRLSTLKYDSLTRTERACYKSSKKLMFHMRNLFRCKALQTFATEENLLHQLEMKIRGSSKPNTDTSTNFLRFFSSDYQGPPDYHRQSTSSSLYERSTVSAGAQIRTTQSPRKTKTLVVWLPEVTLTVSLNLLSRAIHHRNVEEKESEEHVSASLLSRSGKIPRLVRYKEMLEKANNILSYYKKARMDRRMEEWHFQSFCYECGRSCGVVLDECPSCHMVAYCSRSCRLENWRKGHKEECSKSSRVGVSLQSKTSKGSVMPRARPNTGL